MSVPDTLGEINDNLSVLAIEYEGFQDLARLNVHPNTAAKLGEIIAVYTQRINVLNAAKVALENLDGDGYPDLDIFEVAQDIFTDIKANNDTIDAAFAKLAPLTAANLGLSVEVRPKSNT